MELCAQLASRRPDPDLLVWPETMWPWQMILDGRLPSGSRLPANRVLAQDFSLSRNTVATALQQLLAEGYVETRRGDGTAYR